ncbi:MAG: hypothetical protein QOG83_1019 [Alphaproteobacteria bacterium]|nr:hypothetical protein [Alphaproteobacteria bacterium]
MKKLVVSVVAAAIFSATSALAADLKAITKAPPAAPSSPWDIAFGGALMSDYNFRGISQSDRGASGTVYVETRYNANPNLQFYYGSQYWAVALPTGPSCECDLYGGVRPTIGALAFDFGFIYYWYPREKGHSADPLALFPPFPNTNVTYRDTDYWEAYGKVSWDVMKDKFAVGANFYYSPDWLKTGAYGAYGSVTAKLTLPSFKLNAGLIDEVGWYVSGELGHYWLGTTDIDPFVWTFAANLPDYTTWNIGVAFTWKVFTFDLRYYDTDLSKENCNVLTGDPRAVAGGAPSINNPAGLRSRLCSSAVIAALKFDLTAATNLK